MKRSTQLFLAVFLIAAMAFSAFGLSTGHASNGNNAVRVLVEFKPGTRGAVQSALQGAGAEFHYTFDKFNTFAVTVPEAALNGLQHNPNIVSIEEDAVRYPIAVMPSGVAAPSADTVDANGQTVPYGIDMVQARDVWDANRDGAIDAGAPVGDSLTLCIIDSGLYVGHEDMQGVNVVGGYTDISGGWATDGFGHGTHVAGTITAMNNNLGVVGVLPGTANLYIVRVFGDDGAWAYSSSLVDAADHCVSAGAKIISMSLGGGRKSKLEERAFDSYYAQGVLPIAAAGNDGTTDYSYPASYDSVVSVAAIDSAMTVADFSQKNNQVELAAPGVGVLSTLPYVDENYVSAGGVDYVANHIEYAARGTASGTLVDGGLCDSVGAWNGAVVLCERGAISFYDKVINVQNGGGVAAVIYNNEPGNFFGTLGDGYSSNIIGLSLSQEDGQYLVANQLGTPATVSSNLYQPASGYEAWDGTSMATPHVSSVAALVWSAVPTATNQEIRDALDATAYDLGAAGRDDSYGFGLVQAADAIAYLGGGGGGGGGSSDVPMHVADLDGVGAVSRNKWTATVTITVVDANGAALSGVTVDGNWSTDDAASCVTDGAGQCSVVSPSMLTRKVSSVTFTVDNLSASGYYYDAAANADPDGDSDGTSITVLKP